MGFKVMSRACDQCLFSKDRIVSGARAAQIISKTRRDQSHFICHKASIAGDQDVACHEHHKLGIAQMSRIAERLGVVEWIDPVTLESQTP
jgi:hypothetical protein